MEVFVNCNDFEVLFCLSLMQLSLLYVKVIKGVVGSDVINYLEQLLYNQFGPYCQLFPSALCKDRLLMEGHANSG
jgi:hypothetical protein